jgi:hypothetical protein
MRNVPADTVQESRRQRPADFLAHPPVLAVDHVAIADPLGGPTCKRFPSAS